MRVVKNRDLRPGRAIAVVFEDTVMKAKIVRGKNAIKIYYRITQFRPGGSTLSKLRSEEGLTWVRDWNSKASDALRVVCAL